MTVLQGSKRDIFWQRGLSCLNLWRTHVSAQEQNARRLPDAF